MVLNWWAFVLPEIPVWLRQGIWNLWFFKSPSGRTPCNPESDLDTITLSYPHALSKAPELMGALCCHLVGTWVLAQDRPSQRPQELVGLDAHL